jgi:HEXXH motif-containing protein
VNASLSSSRSTPKRRTDSLCSQVKARLRAGDVFLWDQEMSRLLTDTAWQELSERGFVPAEYGTERVLSSNASAERRVIATVAIPLLNSTSALSVELLGDEGSRSYSASGVRFYSAEEILNTNVLNCLSDAIGVLSRTPNLTLLIVALIRSLHLIRPEREECDVSFSEPRLPFSAFVSVPGRRVHDDALRVAEGILHEAMHLHLSLIERVVRLVEFTECRYYSPWRDELRSAQGVLHAIYVFRVIAYFWRTVKAMPVVSEERNYIETRLVQITEQLEQVRSFSACEYLTDDGRWLAQQLLDPDRWCDTELS